MRGQCALRRSVASWVLLCFTGCTALPPMPPLAAGHELAITLPQQEPRRDLKVDVSTASDAITTDGVATATSGALGASAGLAASVGCGLLIVICAPVFMLAGGAAGAGGMAAMADTSRPAADYSTIHRLKRLEERVAAYSKAKPMDEELRLVVIHKASPHWQIVPVSTRHSVSVQVTGFALRAESAERISLEVRATMFMTREDVDHAPMAASAWPQFDTTPKPPAARAVFSGSFWYESSAAGLAQWMDESGEFLNAEFARAYESIAKQIVAALGAPPAS